MYDFIMRTLIFNLIIFINKNLIINHIAKLHVVHGTCFLIKAVQVDILNL